METKRIYGVPHHLGEVCIRGPQKVMCEDQNVPAIDRFSGNGPWIRIPDGESLVFKHDGHRWCAVPKPSSVRTERVNEDHWLYQDAGRKPAALFRGHSELLGMLERRFRWAICASTEKGQADFHPDELLQNLLSVLCDEVVPSSPYLNYEVPSADDLVQQIRELSYPQPEALARVYGKELDCIYRAGNEAFSAGKSSDFTRSTLSDRQYKLGQNMIEAAKKLPDYDSEPESVRDTEP